MNRTMGVGPITDTIFYGAVKDNKWQGKREDVTDIAIKAVFEWFMHKMKANCPDGTYQISFPGIPYVLEMITKETSDRIEKYGQAREEIEKRINSIKASPDYPHNLKGQMVEDYEWVLRLLK